MLLQIGICKSFVVALSKETGRQILGSPEAGSQSN